MTPQDLIAAFDEVAEAPDGVTRLRELVLQLAVRGKLVTQDPNDEPASVLLDRIAGEKARLVKEGKIRKPKPLPPVLEDEVPFDTPSGWAWCRLQAIGDWGAGATPRRGNSRYYGGPINWFKSGELPDGKMRDPSEERVTETALDECSLRENRPGDVLIAMYGATIGKLGLLEVPGTTNQAVCACSCHEGFYNRYLFLLLAAWRERFVGRGEGGAQPNISKIKIVSTAVPVAPLTEQHRIVAKVDELMALLDRLEAARNACDATRTALRDAALAALRDADTSKQVEIAWTRIAERMDDLFTDPADVDPLRQTVLQLAVRGRLVPQDPNDEPASVLLERIEEEKARLVKDGQIRKPKLLPPLSEDEIPFEAPEGWTWRQLGDFALVRGGKRLPKGHSYSEIATPHVYVQVTNMKRGTLVEQPRKFIAAETFEVIKKYVINSTDLYITIAGTIGETGLVPPEFDGMSLTENAAKISPFVTSREFLHLFLQSNVARAHFSEQTNQQAQPKLALKRIATTPVSLPPSAEQRRIVIKVDELMGLLDCLEQRLADKTTAHDAFAAAAVHHIDV